MSMLVLTLLRQYLITKQDQGDTLVEHENIFLSHHTYLYCLDFSKYELAKMVFISLFVWFFLSPAEIFRKYF